MAIIIGLTGYLLILVCLCALVGATRRKEHRVLRHQLALIKRH
jgi:hypothetical protein